MAGFEATGTAVAAACSPMLDNAHALSPEDAARVLGTDPERGLSPVEAASRLERYGPNRPRRPQRPAYLRLAFNQVLDPLVLLLLAATAVSVAIGDVAEGIAVAAVLVLNGVLGFWQELSAERAILALSQAFTQTALVLRDGVEHELDAEQVVPGDVLVLAEGDRVAADGRVIEEHGLEVDESALTGESLPVAKHRAEIHPDAALAERTSMVYAGCGVTRGRGRVLVCATGDQTELGGIGALTAEARPPQTPLEARLGRLARQMVVAGIAITAVLAVATFLRGDPAHEAFLIGVAVAVAAVPEGLAATVTAALALGAQRMARRGAIVRQLEAIETLGETSVICTDKTGTLTQNRIRVAALRPAPGASEPELLRAAVLASTARRSDSGTVGDPIERALIEAAAARGLRDDDLMRGRQPVWELPFDSERKRMTVVYDEGAGRRAYMKGAPEKVAEHASAVSELAEVTSAWAGEGFRVLAVASKALPRRAGFERCEDDHELLGVIAFHDPLRPTATDAVAEAQAAGIQVRMITGDHPATARTIGHALGLAAEDVLARATPADKLALVQRLQGDGAVVAVTGDGVNDAPALRQADVGIAMGRAGTEAAREAAAIVLTDDDFATIVGAVEEGRRIEDNIRKFVAFLLSANLGEVLVFAVAVAAGLGAPLAVIQVLFVNLVTDGLPALALAADPTTAQTMATPPRRGSRLFDRPTWVALGLVGCAVGGATLAAFAAGRALGGGTAQTMAFATLALSELALVFGLRSETSAAWRLPRNRWLVSAVLTSTAVVATVIYAPFAHGVFGTTPLDLRAVLLVAALALLPIGAVELAKGLRRRSMLDTPGGPRANRGIADATAMPGPVASDRKEQHAYRR